MELNQRIIKARKDAGLTQEGLAEAVGFSRSAVYLWEEGSVRPRHTTIEKIASVTDKPLLWLESGIGADGGVGLMVIGRVAAGVWKEGSVNFKAFPLPVTPHPAYPAQAQRLWEIEGTSINKLAREGEYLHAVKVIDGGVEPEDGDLVIVRRMEHGMAEYTAKVLILRNGKPYLKPESDDPEWQNEFEVTGDDSSEIEILDIVIAKWSPLGRRARA